jgi:hypothetical protein
MLMFKDWSLQTQNIFLHNFSCCWRMSGISILRLLSLALRLIVLDPHFVDSNNMTQKSVTSRMILVQK